MLYKINGLIIEIRGKDVYGKFLLIYYKFIVYRYTSKYSNYIAFTDLY